MRDVLADFDVDVQWANELDEALSVLEQTAFPVVLVDRRFGDGWDRGLEIIHEIKHRYPQQELILLSNHWSEESAINALKQDAFSAVRKNEFKLLKTEIENATLKDALREVEIPRFDLQTFLMDEGTAALRRDLYRLEHPALAFAECMLLVVVLDNLQQLSQESLRVQTRGTLQGKNLPSLTNLSDDALRQLADVAHAVARSQVNRQTFSTVATRAEFFLTVNEKAFIKLLVGALVEKPNAPLTDAQRVGFLMSFLKADLGVTKLSGQVVADCLLNRCQHPQLRAFNVRSFMPLHANVQIDEISQIVAALHAHKHANTFSRELVVLDLLVDLVRRYQDLCDVEHFSLEHGDWLEIFRDQMVPLLSASRELRTHLVAFSALREPIETCHILAARFNRKFVEFLWNREVGYASWVAAIEHGERKARPMLTTDILQEVVVPRLNRFRRVLFIVFDGMSLLSWHRIRSRLIGPLFDCEVDAPAFAVVPTSTRYARSALFSGQLPRSTVPSDVTKNSNEPKLFSEALHRMGANAVVTEKHFIKYDEDPDRRKDEQSHFSITQWNSLLELDARAGGCRGEEVARW